MKKTCSLYQNNIELNRNSDIVWHDFCRERERERERERLEANYAPNKIERGGVFLFFLLDVTIAKFIHYGYL